VYYWKTSEVIDELSKISKVKKVASTQPGGDYDTTEVIVHVVGCSDRLYVSGFYSTEECIPNPDDSTVEWVEISDGLDSRGGLNSTNDNLAEVYIKIRQYFAKRGASIINHYSEIF